MNMPTEAVIEVVKSMNIVAKQYNLGFIDHTHEEISQEGVKMEESTQQDNQEEIISNQNPIDSVQETPVEPEESC